MGHKKTTYQPGIWKHKAQQDDPDVKVADFSYTANDKLAKVVTQAWLDKNNYKQKLLNPNGTFAKQELEKAGLKLKQPVVITEDEYNAGWQMEIGDDVVFVLPNAERVNFDPNTDTDTTLLETAKMLMAVTPNGI